MSNEAELQTQQKPPRVMVLDDSKYSMLMDSARFVQIQRVGQWLSESTCIPELFQANPANCGVAVALALRLEMDVLMLMQKMYVVHGKPGIEAQLKIALVNARGPFDGPIDWKVEGEGKSRRWTAFAKLRGSNRVVEFTVDWAMVEGEGWDKPRVNKKTGFSQPSKWGGGLADKMGRYRSASYLIDLYCPDVVMGMATADELLDSEHEISGERVDERPKILAPRAKQIAESPTEFKDEPDLKTPDVKESMKDVAIEKRNAAVIDQSTGEISERHKLMEEAYSQPPVNERTPEPTKKDLTEEERKPITRGLCSVLKTKMEGAGLTLDDCKTKFGKTIEQLNFAEADDVMDWINAHNSAAK